ncbi:MAG: acyltransferase [Alphaproteobacteria bacterium]|nr:acyltransferase [Alphaproteobacteria bacterium]MDP6591084.1 acyltransferase [Alphaproteobacteria bacterium]
MRPETLGEEAGLIHPLSDTQSENIGDGTQVWQFTVILPGAVIGRDCNIGANCFIENDVRIGDGVTIKNGVQIWDRITVEDGAFIGPNATFTNDLIPRSRRGAAAGEPELTATLIGEGATIGANATIVCGISVGRYAMIGAGSVVTDDVPEFSLIYGNPARVKGRVNEEGEIIDRRKKRM